MIIKCGLINNNANYFLCIFQNQISETFILYIAGMCYTANRYIKKLANNRKNSAFRNVKSVGFHAVCSLRQCSVKKARKNATIPSEVRFFRGGFYDFAKRSAAAVAKFFRSIRFRRVKCDMSVRFASLASR